MIPFEDLSLARIQGLIPRWFGPNQFITVCDQSQRALEHRIQRLEGEQLVDRMLVR